MLRPVQWAFGFFALGLGYLILATIQAYSFARIGSNLGEKVRRLFYRAVIYMEVGWFDQDANTSGALSSRLASDAPMVRGAVSDVMGITIQNMVTFISAYVIAFVNGWRMTLLITAVLPLLGFSSWMQIKFFTGAPLFLLPCGVRSLIGQACASLPCKSASACLHLQSADRTQAVALPLCTAGQLTIHTLPGPVHIRAACNNRLLPNILAPFWGLFEGCWDSLQFLSMRTICAKRRNFPCRPEI